MSATLAPEITPSNLRQLLIGKKPQIFHFHAAQSPLGRAALIDTIPHLMLDLARKAMLDEILTDSGLEEEHRNKPLLYFMADREEAGDDWEIRALSEDWRMFVYSDGPRTLCDFNGWPGDNERGAGVYFDLGTGTPVLLFVNSDEALELAPGVAADPALAEVLSEYEAYRETLTTKRLAYVKHTVCDMESLCAHLREMLDDLHCSTYRCVGCGWVSHVDDNWKLCDECGDHICEDCAGELPAGVPPLCSENCAECHSS